MNDAIIMWLFAVVALELKHRAPKAHTMLVRRSGAHLLFSLVLFPQSTTQRLPWPLPQIALTPKRTLCWTMHLKDMLADDNSEQHGTLLATPVMLGTAC